MIILLSFKVLGNNVIANKNIMRDLKQSDFINVYTESLEEFKTLESEIDGYSPYDFLDKPNFKDKVVKGLEELTLYCFDYHNNNLNSKLWLDEIATIFLDKGKAKPLDDPNDYVDFSEVKQSIAEGLYKMSKSYKSFDIKKFVDIAFVVSICAIDPKYPPSFVFYNKKKKS